MEIKKNQKGFSIIELLLGVILLATITASLIPLFTKSIAANNASRKKLYAYQTAHAEVEKLRNQPFEDLEDSTFTVTGIQNATGSIDIDTNIDGSEETDIVKVTASIFWNIKGRNESVQLISYIAEKGIY